MQLFHALVSLGLVANAYAVDAVLWANAGCKGGGAKISNLAPNECMVGNNEHGPQIWASISYSNMPNRKVHVRGHNGGKCRHTPTNYYSERQPGICISASPNFYSGTGYGYPARKRRIGDRDAYSETKDECPVEVDSDEGCTQSRLADTIVLEDGSELAIKLMTREQVDEVTHALVAGADMPSYLGLYKVKN